MPHAIIEYSENLSGEFQAQGVSKAVHTVLTECGLFKNNDVRTRAYPAEDYWVGGKAQDGRFVHVLVYLLEGRTTEQKQSLSQSVIDRLGGLMKSVDFISVDVRELMKDVYRKIPT